MLALMVFLTYTSSTIKRRNLFNFYEISNYKRTNSAQLLIFVGMLAPNPFSRIRYLKNSALVSLILGLCQGILTVSLIKITRSSNPQFALILVDLKVFLVITYYKYLNKKKQLDTNDTNFLWIFILDELYFRHVKNHRLALHCLHTRRFVFLNFNL